MKLSDTPSTVISQAIREQAFPTLTEAESAEITVFLQNKCANKHFEDFCSCLKNGMSIHCYGSLKECFTSEAVQDWDDLRSRSLFVHRMIDNPEHVFVWT